MKLSMQVTRNSSHAAPTNRWERYGLAVFRASEPLRPGSLHRCMQAGRRLWRRQPPPKYQLRSGTLERLLPTASGSALSWSSRATCRDHTTWPFVCPTRPQVDSAHSHVDTPLPFEVRIQRGSKRHGLPSEALA
jgi:hypothetical protein